MEEAQLAGYPALAEEAARLLLNNRALATALIQLHSNYSRYAELCSFLDGKVAAMVEAAIRSELLEPSTGEFEDDEIPAWTGEAAPCAAKTQKGKACTRPGTLQHDNRPFCSQHYPYPDGYYEEREPSKRAWSEYHERRREALDRYRELERSMSGLSRMNYELSGTLRALGIPEPPLPDRNPSHVAERTTYVDGLAFEFTLAGGRQNEQQVRRPACSDVGMIQQVPGRGWAAYVTFYRIRRRRDLGWFGSAIEDLAKVSGVLTTPQPLVVLCGITQPGLGWRVFRFFRTEWHCAYSGDSEAEARWNYDVQEEDRSQARILVDPAHQVVDSHSDSRSLW